ncbi:MAG: hypothetical protein EOM58_10010, partial [Clostridia bacterium]|nr:hypothetical protein [Clostridia bacterium]
MLARALCFALNGIQGEPVMVEADVSNSDKFVFNLVGLPDAAVKESRERVFAALKNSGFTQPYVRTTVNLSPADLRKEGTAFDLPIAVAIIAASRQARVINLEDTVLLGELALDGRMAPVHGALSLVIAARERGYSKVVLPLQNAREMTAQRPPKLLLLTGGASRMPFFRDLCRETFENAVVVCCPEPEYSIAKGLAYAGWIDENLRAFRQEIRSEITDARVADIARNALPELLPGVTSALSELVLSKAAIPIARQWKQGQIDTLDEMNRRISERTERVLSSDLCEKALEPVITQWVKGLSGRLQALVDPICDRHHVPREEMRLSFVPSGETGKISFGAKDMLGFELVGALVSIVAGILAGLLCGGTGTAIIMAGPVG